MQVCRICLNSDRKMYIFDSKRIHLYEQITGETFDPEDLLPKYVCWECGYYMSKYVAFKSKTMRSQFVLNEILHREGLITISNCTQYKLESNLSLTDVLYLNIKEEERDASLESSKIKKEIECNESGVNDFLDVKNEVILVSDDDNHYSDCIAETSTDDFIISPPSNNGNLVNENKDTAKEKKKSHVKLSCNIQGKRRKKSCEVNAENENSNTNSNNKKVKRAPAKRKGDSALSRKSVGESFRNLIDESIINFTEITLDDQIAEIQNRKESDNYKLSTYKCDKCFKGFLDDATFDRHMALHADSRGDVECPLCRKRFSIHAKLTQHMASHMYKFTCKQCSFTAISIEVARKHQNFHRGKRHECPHCKEVYVHRTSLLGHIRVKHPSDFVCPHCGLSFISDFGLSKHIKWVHRFEQEKMLEDGLNCAVCDMRFSSQEAFDNHILVSAKHADQREQMGVSFAYRKRKNGKRQGRKKSNTRTYPTSKPYPEGPKQCEQCDQMLASPRAYYAHFRRVHKDKNRTVFRDQWGERRMCEICGKLFPSGAMLRSHQYAHSSTKEFKCDRCGKAYQLEIHLRNHQKNHCGIRVDYLCSVCGKTFSSTSNRSRHMVVHKGHKYECELCDKVFSCPGNKKNHIDFVHKKKPWPKRNRGPRRRGHPESQEEGAQQNPPEADMEEEWNTPLSKLKRTI